MASPVPSTTSTAIDSTAAAIADLSQKMERLTQMMKERLAAMGRPPVSATCSIRPSVPSTPIATPPPSSLAATAAPTALSSPSMTSPTRTFFRLPTLPCLAATKKIAKKAPMKRRASTTIAVSVDAKLPLLPVATIAAPPTTTQSAPVQEPRRTPASGCGRAPVGDRRHRSGRARLRYWRPRLHALRGSRRRIRRGAALALAGARREGGCVLHLHRRPRRRRHLPRLVHVQHHHHAFRGGLPQGTPGRDHRHHCIFHVRAARVQARVGFTLGRRDSQSCSTRACIAMPATRAIDAHEVLEEMSCRLLPTTAAAATPINTRSDHTSTMFLIKLDESLDRRYVLIRNSTDGSGLVLSYLAANFHEAHAHKMFISMISLNHVLLWPLPPVENNNKLSMMKLEPLLRWHGYLSRQGMVLGSLGVMIIGGILLSSVPNRPDSYSKPKVILNMLAMVFLHVVDIPIQQVEKLIGIQIHMEGFICISCHLIAYRNYLDLLSEDAIECTLCQTAPVKFQVNQPMCVEHMNSYQFSCKCLVMSGLGKYAFSFSVKGPDNQVHNITRPVLLLWCFNKESSFDLDDGIGNFTWNLPVWSAGETDEHKGRESLVNKAFAIQILLKRFNASVQSVMLMLPVGYKFRQDIPYVAGGGRVLDSYRTDFLVAGLFWFGINLVVDQTEMWPWLHRHHCIGSSLCYNCGALSRAKYSYIAGTFPMVSPDPIQLVVEHAVANNKVLLVKLSAPFISESLRDAQEKLLLYADFILGKETNAKIFSQVQELEAENIEEIALKIYQLPMAPDKQKMIAAITQDDDPVVVAENGEVKMFSVILLPKEQLTPFGFQNTHRYDSSMEDFVILIRLILQCDTLQYFLRVKSVENFSTDKKASLAELLASGVLQKCIDQFQRDVRISCCTQGLKSPWGSWRFQERLEGKPHFKRRGMSRTGPPDGLLPRWVA